MKMPVILRSTHTDIVDRVNIEMWEVKKELDEANADINSLRFKNNDLENQISKLNIEKTVNLSKLEKVNKENKNLEEKVKAHEFCLNACKDEKNQVAKENIKVMKKLAMNKEFKRQLLNIIHGDSDVTFNKKNICELVMLL